MNQHTYKTTVEWTGNKGSGTYDYRSYSRSHIIKIDGKANILGSSDSSFRGEKSKHNPEDMFVASISACHMLWYLHLCADAGVIVLKYKDDAEGSMIVDQSGGGRFNNVTLRPTIEITKESSLIKAEEAHTKAHGLCFIANSCNFDILVEPIILKAG